MNRRQFHHTAAASAAGIAFAGRAAGSAPAVLPLVADPLPAGAVARFGSGRLWHLWPASNPGLNDLTFSPDGRHLATLGYQDSHVAVWSVPDGRLVCDWEPQLVDRGGDLLWTDAGLYVASCGGLSLWEPLTATLAHRFLGGEGEFAPAQGVAGSPDGRWLACTHHVTGQVTVFDAATRAPTAELFIEVDGKPPARHQFADVLLSVAFSRCGRWVVAGGYAQGTGGTPHGHIHVWDLAGRKHLTRYSLPCGPVGRLAFTPAGKLLTSDWCGVLVQCDPFDGRVVDTSARLSTGYVRSGMHVTVSGRIAVQRDRGLCLWNPDPAREVVLWPDVSYPRVAVSDDGRWVAGGGGSGRIDLFDAVAGADVSPTDRHGADVRRLELSADGTICLSSIGHIGPNTYGELALRDTRTGRRLDVAPPAEWRPLALAPVGTRIAGRQFDGRLGVWDWGSGTVERYAEEFNPTAVAWHPDGRTLLAAGEGGRVIAWDVTAGRADRQPIPEGTNGLGAAVGVGGVAALLADDGGLFVWQLGSTTPPRRLAVPPPGASAV